jgi:SAM-dependent methyltransferase
MTNARSGSAVLAKTLWRVAGAPHWCAVVLTLLLASCASPPRNVPVEPSPPVRVEPTEPPKPTPTSPIVERLANEALALKPLAVSGLTLRFLDAARALPAVGSRTVYLNEVTREYFSPAERDRLPEAQRTKLASVELDEYRYYYTKYGSPLAYLRAIEIAAANGLPDVAGKRIFDFGYGSIGHLRILASLGAHVTGADPDSYLDALYHSPRDQGSVPSALGGRRAVSGSVTLAHGFWPKEAAMVEKVGQGFDLIVSKNTLKKGYVKPDRRTDRRQQISLGVSDEAFLRTLHGALNPGGLLLIYNISPKQSERYNPQADGRSPWTPEQYERAGFRVLSINATDDAAVRDMGRALGWDKTGAGEALDLNTNIFALYTLLAKPR